MTLDELTEAIRLMRTKLRGDSQLTAYCVDRPSGTLIVIGTQEDAESEASVMRAGGVEELMLNGPYDLAVPNLACREQA